jgi:Ca-activated chloride channel family protein
MTGRLVVIALAIGAVAFAAISALGGGGGDTKKKAAPSNNGPTAGAVRISFAYSPEKTKLIAPLVKRYNAQQSGVFVEGQEVASGTAETGIARGKLRPTAWSPASSLWGRLLDHEADRSYVADQNPSLVRTPLVIAMWEPLARALGWPRKPVGWSTVLKLALDDRGWAAYGRPQYGAFKLGHTNPDFSTSGLSAVAAEYFTAAGKQEGLTEADISKPEVRRRIKAIERSIVHYGDTTLFFADQLLKDGPAYASAVAMEEATLVDFNKRRGSRDRLVALYPREGTFFSDNPYIVLEAPWASPEQRKAAARFGDWLRQQLTPEAAAAQGFRPGDASKRALPPVDAAHGADPAEPRRVLALPEPAVLARVKRLWRQDRKPANVVVVVDTSGSMSQENRLGQAKHGLRAFLRELEPQDHVGLESFNDQVFQLVPLGTVAAVGRRVSAEISQLVPDGQTAVYDATAQAVREVEGTAGANRINAVVVLTDGQDNQSSISSDALVSRLRANARGEQAVVRVFTIAYGSDANSDVLKQIAEASGGKGFRGDPAGIEAVYLQISSFF